MVAPANSWVPGYRFKDGKLLIFEADRITLVRAWPEPEAAQKVGDSAWRPLRPDFRLVRPYRRRTKNTAPDAPQRQLLLPLQLPPAPPTRSELSEQKRRAFDALRFSLPRELARAIERFPCAQFALIEMFRAAVAYLDLLVSNPSLAFYLAQELARYGHFDQADQLATRKQPELAERLGFPATPAAARTLRKVVPESVTPESARQLRLALRNDDAQRKLSHLPQINAGVMRLLGDERLQAAAAPTLLEEVAEDGREKYRAETADLLQDVLTLEQELHGAGRCAPFGSVARVREVHEQLSEDYANKKASGILECRFPAPPVRGTMSIVPLAGPRDLIAEGLRQHNCVASYAPAVARGDTFIYRVLRPERATLAIRLESGDRWYCAEIRAACNGRVSRATEQAVRDWLDERTVSA